MSKLEKLIVHYDLGEMTRHELAIQIKRVTMDLYIESLQTTENIHSAAFAFGDKLRSL